MGTNNLLVNILAPILLLIVGSSLQFSVGPLSVNLVPMALLIIIPNSTPYRFFTVFFIFLCLGLADLPIYNFTSDRAYFLSPFGGFLFAYLCAAYISTFFKVRKTSVLYWIFLSIWLLTTSQIYGFWWVNSMINLSLLNSTDITLVIACNALQLIFASVIYYNVIKRSDVK